MSKWLSRIEDALYFAIGSLLVGAALVLLIWTVLSFVRMTAGGNVGEAVLQTLDSLLLVVMLVEILHTVGISIQGHTLVAEPFLVVGLIAAIRRILVVTAEQAEVTAERAEEFRMAMLELGILTVMILVLVGAIYIVRRTSTHQQEASNVEPTLSLTPSRQADSERT
jgi:uncharacterized membrane protein (DUF373 family)